MKNKILIAAFFSVFLLIASNVQAANFKDNQIVDANKTWTITFSSDVGLDNGKIQGITVTDSKGNTVLVDVKLGQDNKTVIVTAPTGDYTAGESYILNVGSKTHSSKGNALKNEYKVNFNIKTDTISDNVVTFKDKNLEKAVRDAIKKPTGDIYKSDVEKIAKFTAKWMEIQNISGIENLTNLQTLDLSNNQISDISVLRGLTNLQSLNLENNDITDISALKKLTNLSNLVLYGAKLNDISALKDLTNLQKLNLGYTQLNDISALKDLTNLQSLNLGANKISDISVLKELTNLQSIYLEYNQISDISALKGLTNLKSLCVYENQISDISALKGLTNLQRLDISDNQVSDISILEGLSNLKTLYLGNNPISDADKQSLESALPNCIIKYIRDYK